MPRAARLLPYLETIDANRWYTNRGELVNVLEARLGDRLGGGRAKVISAASGTAAIEAAILATAGRATLQRPFALLPAYTFVATACAVERCGYLPYLLDIEPDTWALAARRLEDHPMLQRAGVVVPVAPYGCAIEQADWVEFASRTKVPVVIDAAAGFEAVAADPQRCTGTIPVALSFQATKAFSCGEGGAVIWSDADGLLRVVRSLNFGILWKRESTSPGTNGKMSEYHAAVGLASLDEWDQTFSNFAGGTAETIGVVTTDILNNNYVLSEAQGLFPVPAGGQASVPLVLAPVVANVFLPTPTRIPTVEGGAAAGSLETTIFLTDELGYVIPHYANAVVPDNAPGAFGTFVTISPATSGLTFQSDDAIADPPRRRRRCFHEHVAYTFGQYSSQRDGS